MYSYVTPDLVKEFAKFDEKPEKYFKEYNGFKVILRTITANKPYFFCSFLS